MYVFEMTLIHLSKVIELVKGRLKGEREVRLAFLFGSYSRGDFDEESDVDILVVSDDVRKTRKKLNELSWEIQMDYGVAVSFLVIPWDRWSKKLTPLREIVEEEGKLIWKREEQ